MVKVSRALFAAVASLLIWSSAASAGAVTINFDSLSPSYAQASNLVYDGFRFSPNGYYNTGSNPGTPAHGILGGSYLTWEVDGTIFNPPNQYANPAYLGPSSFPNLPHLDSLLYVDNFGKPFSLREIAFILPRYAVTMISSAGGFFTANLSSVDLMDVTLNSGLWDNITWLLFGDVEAGGPAGGIDHLVLDVPEPSVASVLWLALLLVLALRYGVSLLRRNV